jgi:hypothetical protein
VFLTKSRKANLDTADAAARARAAGKAAQLAAKNAVQRSAEVAQAAAERSSEVAQKSQAAAQNVGSTAQTTAAGVSKQVQQGVYTARRWAAPKLESVADYAVTTVAPTVSSALRNTAAQVRPAEPVSPARRRSTSALTWSVLGAALLAAVGAAAAVARYRRRRAAAAVDREVPDGALGEATNDAEGTPTGQRSAGQRSAGQTPTATKPTGHAVPAAGPSASANQTETVTDASVNGRANTSGW